VALTRTAKIKPPQSEGWLFVSGNSVDKTPYLRRLYTELGREARSTFLTKSIWTDLEMRGIMDKGCCHQPRAMVNNKRHLLLLQFDLFYFRFSSTSLSLNEHRNV
jgi:hypothetical protein